MEIWLTYKGLDWGIVNRSGFLKFDKSLSDLYQTPSYCLLLLKVYNGFLWCLCQREKINPWESLSFNSYLLQSIWIFRSFFNGFIIFANVLRCSSDFSFQACSNFKVRAFVLFTKWKPKVSRVKSISYLSFGLLIFLFVLKRSCSSIGFGGRFDISYSNSVKIQGLKVR